MLGADDGCQVVGIGIHFFAFVVKFLDFFIVDHGEVIDEMERCVHTFGEVF